MNNFYFFRPEHRHEDETFLKWKKLQHYLFYNYKIPEYNNGKFDFTAYGSPIYGVVDNILLLIPFENDNRVKPELLNYFKEIWNKINDESIIPHSIEELYKMFDLDNYVLEDSNFKIDGGIISYKHEHTFYKN